MLDLPFQLNQITRQIYGVEGDDGDGSEALQTLDSG